VSVYCIMWWNFSSTLYGMKFEANIHFVPSECLLQISFHRGHHHARIVTFKRFSPYVLLTQQEGQHPLTGQRVANFRLLANH